MTNHCRYRNFWIRDTKKNRRKVDSFYEQTEITPKKPAQPSQVFSKLPAIAANYDSLADLIMDVNKYEDSPLKDVFLSHLTACIMGGIDQYFGPIHAAPNAELQAVACRNLLRTVVKAHRCLTTIANAETLISVLGAKMIELCQVGIIEAYLAFSLYYPELCTREIQPYFNYDSPLYNYNHWLTLTELPDPDYGPLINNVYNLSGFNKDWRDFNSK